MSGYVGVEPIPQANTIINQGTIAATTSSIFVPNGYNVGNIEVFLNGLRLKASDFTATDGVYVNFAQTLSAGTDYIIQDVRNYQQADVDSRIGNLNAQSRSVVARLAAEAGFNLVDGSFEEGGTVNSATDALWSESTGAYLTWGGTLPKVVAAGTTPETTGGIGAGAWVDRTESTLRGDLIAGAMRQRGNYISLRDFVSVLDFGAIGNGVANDLAAINLAAEFARVNGSGLLFPSGYTFAINGMILIRDGVRAVYGHGAKILAIAGPGPLMSGILLAGKHSGYGSNVKNCHVDGLYFDANNLWAVPIFGENISLCKITNNTIVNVLNGQGILNRCFIDGLEDSYSNVITGNIIHGDTGSHPKHHGIVIDSEMDYTTYSDAIVYWKAHFSAQTPTYVNAYSIVSSNKILGGYYGVSLSGAKYCEITGNQSSMNVRNISAQNGSIGNTISNNLLTDSISSGVHLAYGSSLNSVLNNNIITTRANLQGLIQAYVGSKSNTFKGNKLSATGLAAPKWFIYCGVKSDDNNFTNNEITGMCTKAYICVESAWDNSITTVAHYGYGEDDIVNNFSNAGMTNVVVCENIIHAESEVPAIHLSQISDTSAYPLQCHVVNNIIRTNNPSYQLSLIEQTTGNLTGNLKGNSFHYAATPSKFLLPRGRAHFTKCENNSIINDSMVFLPNEDTSPSVGVGKYFTHTNTSATSVTYYDDGAELQEITIRLNVNTTLVHNSSLMRLKDDVNATGNSNNFITLQKISGIWFERSRNF